MSLLTGFTAGVKSWHDIYEEVQEGKSTQWRTIESKFEDLLYSLREIKNTTESKKAISLLSDILPLLETHKIKFAKQNEIFQRIRGVFLELWHLLLISARSYMKHVLYNFELRKKVLSSTRAFLYGGASDQIQVERVSSFNDENPLNNSHESSDEEEKKRFLGEKKPNEERSDPKPQRDSYYTLPDLAVIHRAIGFLICRREFDIRVLKIDRDCKAHCTEIDLKIAYRYRYLLFQTQNYIQSLIDAQIKTKEFGQMATFDFAARIISISAIRIPKVMKIIAKTISLSDKEISTITEELSSDYLEDFFTKDDVIENNQQKNENRISRSVSASKYFHSYDHGHLNVDHSANYRSKSDKSHKKENNLIIIQKNEINNEKEKNISRKNSYEKNNFNDIVNDENVIQIPRLVSFVELRVTSPQFNRKLKNIDKYPNLYQWDFYQRVMQKYKMDFLEDKIAEGGWSEQLGKKSSFYFSFIIQYIQHVRDISKNHFSSTNWSSLRGFRVILITFVHQFKQCKNDLSKDMMDTACCLLSTCPSLINFYISSICRNTNVFDYTSTLNTINHFDSLFKYFLEKKISLPSNFNITFFCSAIDIILHTDHHLLLHRLLGLIFNIATLFHHKVEYRQNLFIDLFLHKYFFQLFLHWDSVVRNYFQQILLFKMLKAKRSELFDKPYQIENLEDITDTLIFGKIDSFIRIIEDQSESIPKQYLGYCSIALTEYKAYLNYYNSWEISGEKLPKSIVPVNSLPKVEKKNDQILLVGNSNSVSTISELANNSSDALIFGVQNFIS